MRRHLFTCNVRKSHSGPVATGDTDTFPQILRAAIKVAGTSVRGLAKTLAPEGDEKRLEDERRGLNRYLSGEHLPTRVNADRIAIALGLNAGAFPSSEDKGRRPSIPEQLAEVGELLADLTELVEERLPEPGEEGETLLASRTVAGRLRSLEAKVAELPTAEDLGRAVATLQAAIDRLASRDSREAQQEKPARKRDAR